MENDRDDGEHKEDVNQKSRSVKDQKAARPSH
jgi:hypothetical protein